MGLGPGNTWKTRAATTPGRVVPASVTAAVLAFLLLGVSEFVFGIEGGLPLGTGLARAACGLLLLGAAVQFFLGGRAARIGLCLLYAWFLDTAIATIRVGEPGLTTYPLILLGTAALVLMFVPSANAYLGARNRL